MGDGSRQLSEALGAQARTDLKRGVAHWPGIVALLATAVLLGILIERLTIGPSWLPLGVAAVIVIVVTVARRTGRHPLGRWVKLAFPALTTAAIAISVVVQTRRGADSPLLTSDLLLNAAIMWGTNVLSFALWYWEIDAGGPGNRSREVHASTDLVFPQMTMERTDPAWYPTFLDYLFFSFNTSTAFSPTDTTVLSRRAKLLMMAESLVSLLIVAVLLARASTQQ